ncbi:MAG: pirin-like C-terminal cupin domain-containing protein [Alphaproteobacteria bacterium]|nr:pirin-like C-terminal cupin domain-containing protein [Alphaproteobacteria bacterium]
MQLRGVKNLVPAIATSDGAGVKLNRTIGGPASDKMCAPRYQNLTTEEIPEVDGGAGVEIRVIAGEAGGISGAVSGIDVEPLYLDILLPGETEHVQPAPEGHTALCYVFEGDVAVVDPVADSVADSVVEVPHHTLAVLGADGGRALLIAGQPLGEPVVRYGPFVMNTREEIAQTIDDFRAGRF